MQVDVSSKSKAADAYLRGYITLVDLEAICGPMPAIVKTLTEDLADLQSDQDALWAGSDQDRAHTAVQRDDLTREIGRTRDLLGAAIARAISA